MLSPVKIWRRQKDIRRLLGVAGQVVTWTQVFIPGGDFKTYAPYFVVLVEFADGQKAYGQLVEYDKKTIKKGMRVTGILRKVRTSHDEDIIMYGLKFRPLYED